MSEKVKDLWQRNSHRVQEISHWRNSESQTNVYTGKASFTYFDKNGNRLMKGQCLNIDKNDTIATHIFRCDCCKNINRVLFSLSNGRYRFIIHFLNLIISVYSILILCGFIRKEFSFMAGILWLSIPAHTFLTLNIKIGQRIWKKSMIPWVQLYLSLLETFAFCDICNWDIRICIIGPPMILSQLTIINLDGIYFEAKDKYLINIHIIICILWKLTVLWGIRFSYFLDLRPRNILLLAVEPSSFSLNNVSLYASKTLSMIVFLIGQIYFKCKHPDQAYVLKTHYTIKKNSEWNKINRDNRIVKRNTLIENVSNMRASMEIQV